VQEKVALFFWGLGLVAAGSYARINLEDVPHMRQLADLLCIAGVGVFAYAAVLIILASRSAYR